MMTWKNLYDNLERRVMNFREEFNQSEITFGAAMGWESVRVVINSTSAHEDPNDTEPGRGIIVDIEFSPSARRGIGKQYKLEIQPRFDFIEITNPEGEETIVKGLDAEIENFKYNKMLPNAVLIVLKAFSDLDVFY